MKKILFLATVIFICCGLSAQKSAMVIGAGARNKVRYANYGLNIEYKYGLSDNLSLSADMVIFLPDDGNMGLDAGVNIQYLLKAGNSFVFYPLAGVVVSNHLFSADPNSRSVSDLGFNVGAGVEYNISRKNFINADARYLFTRKDEPEWYRNYAVFTLGYGFRF